MSPDEYLDDDDEQKSLSPRSIFSSGWFRALLVLGVLAIVLVVTLPYLLRWMDSPSRAPQQSAARAPEPPRPAPGAPPAAPAPTVVAAPPTAAQAPPASPEPVAPRAAAVKPPAPAPSVPAGAAKGKSAPEKTGTPSPQAARPAAPAPAAKPTPAPGAESAGDFWVQVGLFRDESKAEQLAKTLRDQGLGVEVAKVTRPAHASPNRHEVFVTGATAEAVNAALRGSGSARPVRGGVAVQPALDLKDAVALSTRLSGEGLTVQIRRVGGESAGGGTFHVVRVGGLATRPQADAVKKDLGRKGLGSFVTQGPAR